MQFDAYTVYCEWCKEHHYAVPTRAWWDAACAKARTIHYTDESEMDIRRERREGWAK
jgi:hypothetical protein